MPNCWQTTITTQTSAADLPKMCARSCCVLQINSTTWSFGNERALSQSSGSPGPWLLVRGRLQRLCNWSARPPVCLGLSPDRRSRPASSSALSTPTDQGCVEASLSSPGRPQNAFSCFPKSVSLQLPPTGPNRSSVTPSQPDCRLGLRSCVHGCRLTAATCFLLQLHTAGPSVTPAGLL